VALLVVGLVAFVAFGLTVKWVGQTDIELRFVITDAHTGQSIPNATIHVRAEPGGFCDEHPQKTFAITTDENGRATAMAKSCMCFGSKGTLKDTFGSHLPNWYIDVTAAGYSEAEPTYLDVAENARRVQRGEAFGTLLVPIRLRSDAAEPSDTPTKRSRPF